VEHRAIRAENLANALQLFRFVLHMLRRDARVHPALADVAYCELGLALLKLTPMSMQTASANWGSAELNDALWARRSAGVRLRLTQYDIRSLLEGNGDLESAAVAPTYIALARRRSDGQPSIFTLRQPAFNLARSLRSWHCFGTLNSLERSVGALRELERSGILDLQILEAGHDPSIEMSDLG
jgi:hypothetical protein